MNLEKEIQDLKQRLFDEIKESIADMKEHHQELDVILSVLDKYGHDVSKNEFIKTIMQDALDDAKLTIAGAEKLIKAAQLLKI